MEIKRMTAETDYVPVDFQVRNLGGSYYEMLQNQNVTKEEGNDRVIYRSDTVLQTVNVTTRSEGIVAFIRMQNYRQYVVWCKEQANIYFSEVV